MSLDKTGRPGSAQRLERRGHDFELVKTRRFQSSALS